MPTVDFPPPFDSYNGKEPYLFVSYAHADSKIVFAEISRLNKLGYHIWYDEGIDPGNEWPEDIANAIVKAFVFLVFISSRAVKSANVRNEINFALKQKKTFLAIYLEDTILPAGLELQMGSIQAIMRYRMNDESFFRKMDKVLVQYFDTEKKNTKTSLSPKIELINDDNAIKLTSNENRISKVTPNCEFNELNPRFMKIKIGDQIWMSKNLNVQNYQNGDLVPQVVNYEEWKNLKTGAWCFYDNNPENDLKYGKLYNWYALNDPRGLAPNGWHIPRRTEWLILAKNQGGQLVAANKMKARGMKHWKSQSLSSAGLSKNDGFFALPGGFREPSGNFSNVGFIAFFWSSSEANEISHDKVWCYSIENNAELFENPRLKNYGFSIRCILS